MSMIKEKGEEKETKEETSQLDIKDVAALSDKDSELAQLSKMILSTHIEQSELQLDAWKQRLNNVFTRFYDNSVYASIEDDAILLSFYSSLEKNPLTQEYFKSLNKVVFLFFAYNYLN